MYSEKRERRSASRAQVSRRIKFEAVDGSTLPQEGIVVNLSADGLRVHTRFPAPLGCIIEMEVDPRADAPDQSAIHARGRVVYVSPVAAKGEYAMGVRLRWSGMLEARSGAAKKRKAARVSAKRATGPARPPVEQGEEFPARKRRKTRIWPILLLLPAVFLWRGAKEMREGLRATEAARSTATADLRRGEAVFAEVDHDAADRGDEGGGMRAPYAPGPAAKAADAPLTVSGGRAPNQEAARPSRLRYRHAGADERKTAIDTGGAEEGMLQLAHRTADGNPDGAVVAAHTMQRPGGTRHDARDRARHGEDGIVAAVRRSLKQTEAPAIDPSEGIHLVIDRSAGTMTVYRGGGALHMFTVGVGEDDRTPLGEFVIHNKLRNPDWFNKGEVVPHGHPRNPLGASWMGFARDGRPISFGIHPTNNPSEVGAKSGEGCVRMTPEDAETLFRLCPIGAKVTIVDGLGV